VSDRWTQGRGVDKSGERRKLRPFKSRRRAGQQAVGALVTVYADNLPAGPSRDGPPLFTHSTRPWRGFPSAIAPGMLELSGAHMPPRSRTRSIGNHVFQVHASCARRSMRPTRRTRLKSHSGRCLSRPRAMCIRRPDLLRFDPNSIRTPLPVAHQRVGQHVVVADCYFGSSRPQMVSSHAFGPPVRGRELSVGVWRKGHLTPREAHLSTTDDNRSGRTLTRDAPA
jgi:hypothetical protein